MKSPAGWIEPGQAPAFDEFTLVLRGVLTVSTRSAEYEVRAGQAVVVEKGEWVRYSSPHPEGAEYIAVCLPAFSPELVNRDSEASFEILGRIFTTPPPQAKRGLKAHHDLMEYEEIQRFRRNVDLCLWANPGANGELLIEGCILFNPCLRSFAEEIAGLRGS